MKRNKKVIVVAGGISSEREVSFRSGKGTLDALIRLGCKADLVDARDPIPIQQDAIYFNSLHGCFGEDGGFQSFMDYYQLLYTGSGVRASKLAMNKALTKQIMLREAIPTLPFQCISRADDKMNIPFPIVSKPVAQGSSVGVQISETQEEYRANIQHTIEHYGACMVEKYLKGTEVTVGVIEHKGAVTALPVLQLISDNRMYDYEAKYTSGKTQFVCPAKIEAKVEAKCRAIAEQLHQSLRCSGYSRVDMIIAGDEPVVLELNTQPGMTTLSDLPAQAKAHGLSYDELVGIMLDSYLLDKY